MSEVETINKLTAQIISAVPQSENVWIRARIDELVEAVRTDQANRIADDPKVLQSIEWNPRQESPSEEVNDGTLALVRGWIDDST